MLAEALILVIADVGSMRNVFEEIESLPMMREASMLAGFYDIMAIGESDKWSEIMDTLIEKIRSIEGVKETTTHIFIE
ncbi:hypothetical protein AKJ66_02845 [candidate division MSBL1 archaeon SCGC-AAA259E22]|uniref:Transcription regulator AsnC/Lrp ligand binding domain-containing protein n=1 Tax=candidate division MSBL1 archaeon SCGC-AAA259E22 TaxID=1698265 RepID=A0A133UFV2_9EURY|nr:hypothetical protein AKJ66_02845 [candidate division MSBL1 archaeon SCGC-AAA259E22]